MSVPAAEKEVTSADFLSSMAGPCVHPVDQRPIAVSEHEVLFDSPPREPVAATGFRVTLPVVVPWEGGVTGAPGAGDAVLPAVFVIGEGGDDGIT